MDLTRIRRLPAAIKLGALLAAIALVAAACSSGGGTSAAASSSSGAAGATTSSNTVTIDARNGSAGTFLTDSRGRTLYMFASDTATRSSCTSACLSVWPVLSATGAVHAGKGADTADISTISTAGKKQVVYHGHPLYYFSGDKGAGQATGQGLDSFGAKWWILSPAGRELTGSASSSGMTSSGGSSSSKSGSGGSGSSGGSSSWG